MASWSDPELSLVPLPGVTLHVAAAGPADGSLTILLHGFPEAWFAWRHQIGPLAAAGLRVLAPDLRGYNRSDKPREIAAYHLDRVADDVLALADRHGAQRVRLVGHDWGGIVGWWLAARSPERIDRLAILNAPHPDVLAAYARRHPVQALRVVYFALFQVPVLPEAALRAADFLALRQALHLTSRPGTFADEDIARYREAWAQPGALEGMLNWYRAMRLKDRRELAPIPVPTLILWGRKDPALSPHLATACLELCKQGRIAWLPEATHWLHHEEPETVAAELTAFLTG
ncbi:alpha/beta fold hydrolase [Methylobacterium frigidaeris]|uniref:Epoxide hydrolase A n=1 Tax=Methylobacterium frigidaeris TaxID=2038277 RepID=A0AA37HHV7_9HYPH|nr:alpha/beta hydrolase [Methylobacterium frigidaeris]GJD66260.1 Epoxide hydrolase A [Methylobacterium frigidaeris]